MIKINLLSEGRRPVVARREKPKLGLGDFDINNVLMIAGLVIGLLVAGVWWWMLNSQLKDVQGKVRRAQAEYRELEPIIKEVEDFKRKKEDLERKVQVIQELKRKQQGPVAIMDRVSRALPDLVWLDSMDVTGATVTLRGQAMNTNAIASFIEGIDKVPEFQEPDTRNVQQQNRGAYSFEMIFNFVQQLPPEEGAEDAAEGGGETAPTGP